MDEYQLCDCTNGNVCCCCQCINDMCGCPFYLWLTVLTPFLLAISITLIYYFINSPSINNIFATKFLKNSNFFYLVVNPSLAIIRKIIQTNYFYSDITYSESYYISSDPCQNYTTTVPSTTGQITTPLCNWGWWNNGNGNGHANCNNSTQTSTTTTTTTTTTTLPLCNLTTTRFIRQMRTGHMEYTTIVGASSLLKASYHDTLIIILLSFLILSY